MIQPAHGSNAFSADADIGAERFPAGAVHHRPVAED
jgi:hypothetical protein